MITWHDLTSEADLMAAIERSKTTTVGIFKHSTRCHISKMAKQFLEGDWEEQNTNLPEMYYLDLLSYRPISARISEVLNEPHESPQLLLVKDGECIWEASHQDIRYNDIKSFLKV
jgi:bacillithiol system protein YtxJ